MPAPIEASAGCRLWLALGLLLVSCIALAQQAPSSPASIPSTPSGATSSSQLPQAVKPVQPGQWPGPDDMARAVQGRPLPTPERLATHPLHSVPNVAPSTGQPSATGAIDIAAMARQGAALTTMPPTASGATSLRIFITLDMPRASLQRLIEQSERAGATLVLRGLKAQSMRQTLAAAAELIGERRVSWVIDPNAFKRFGISAAPTFVLTLAGDPVPGIPIPSDPSDPGKTPGLPQCTGNGCTTPANPAEYLSIAGDVSLDYALDVMLRHSPDAVPHASAILQRLRKP